MTDDRDDETRALWEHAVDARLSRQPLSPDASIGWGAEADADDHLTDAGAAERFARLHGDDLRYDHRRARWLLWSGHRWTPDTDGALTRIALEFVRAWQHEAVELTNRTRADAMLKFARRLERRDALTAMLAIARDLRPIADAGDQWDADPWLLGVPNGVIDLRTGALRPGWRADRITMTASVVFDAQATCPRWERFLDEIFDGDAELVAFIARAVGYSLTGNTREQCLFLCHGAGSNGKGTLTTTLTGILGDYAYNMPFTTIESQQRAAIPNDLAALVGRRLVVASETNDGTRLNEARIKALTGCDPITARFLHSEFFTFEPVAKFWLAVNHKPIVRDDSYGFWRRMRLVPFDRTFAIDGRLADTLAHEAPGILAWAVRGALAWQRDGLTAPAAVLTATEEYERDSDPLAAFFAEACRLDPDAETGANDLYKHYRGWADGHAFSERERLSTTMFGRKMAERFRRAHTRAGGVYFGVSTRRA